MVGMSKSKIFLWALLAFIAGVAVRSLVFVPSLVIGSLFALGVGISSAGLCSVIARKFFVEVTPLRTGETGTEVAGAKVMVGCFLILSFVLGIFRLELAERLKPNLSAFYGKDFMLSGYISDDPKQTSFAQHLKVWVESADGEKLKHPFFIRVTTRRYPRYKIGDELRLRGVIKNPENVNNEFDYVAYLAKEDIYAVIAFPTIEKIGEGRGNQLKIILSRIKYAFESNLESVLPEPHGAFLKGLTLGERESIPPELTENFNRTGVTHIIALSGYNITLVATFFSGILLWLTIPFRVAFWIAVFSVSSFVILTGATPSVVRAGVMGVLLLISQREGRMYRITNALVFTGAIMIFHNPKILRFDAAFQLSFLATLGLIFLSPPIDDVLRKIWHALRRSLGFVQATYIFEKDDNQRFILFPFRKVLAETLSAQLMVLPLLIYLFGKVSLVSPLSNLLVILAVPPSMALGFLTGAFGFVWKPLAQASAAFNWVLLEYKIRVIEFFASVSGAYLLLKRWIAFPLFLFYAAFFIRLWLRSRKI